MWGNCEVVQENKKHGAPRNQSKRQMSFFLNEFIHSGSTCTRHLQRQELTRKTPVLHGLTAWGASGRKIGFMGAGPCSPMVERVLSICEATPSPTSRRRKSRPRETAQTVKCLPHSIPTT